MDFNQLIRGGGSDYPVAKETMSLSNRKRTFKETIQDQIAYHKAKVAELEAVNESLTPEIEKFVEAIQKLGQSMWKNPLDDKDWDNIPDKETEMLRMNDEDSVDMDEVSKNEESDIDDDADKEPDSELGEDDDIEEVEDSTDDDD